MVKSNLHAAEVAASEPRVNCGPMKVLKVLPRQALSPFLEGLRVLPSKFILADSHQPKSADIPFYVCPGQLKSAEYPGGPFVSLFELSHLFFEIKHRHPNPLSSSYAPACHVPWRRRAATPRAASCPGRTLTERCYFPTSQSCLEAFINEAQSSGGFPRASILAKTVYGSVLLPDERSVDRSLTHA